MSEEATRESPTDQYKYWMEEFQTARKAIKKWQKEGKKVVRKFLDERGDDQTIGPMDTRLNLFYSNIITLKSMLYGSVPKVEVNRTFQDADDDIARVAGLMATRMLQQDIEESGEDFATSLRNALEDRLIPGLGTARVKYDYESEQKVTPAIRDPMTGQELAPAVTEEVITDEWVEIVYTHWQDYLWSAARIHSEITWKAFRSYLTREELVERFGEELGKKIPLESNGPTATKTSQSNTEILSVKQAEVWEIWCKKKRKVYWLVEGFNQILDVQDDPLGLDGFFPDPMPMMANTTTTKYVPRSDYAMAQDLYMEIDRLQTRISILTEACRCVGVYDKANESIKRIFTEGMENDLIPVDNWAMLGEKGGLKGVIDWVPLEAVANTITILSQRLDVKIQQLYELTGLSDILRGASQPYEAAATSKAKVQFASIRVQALQDEFARFASDLQALKMEIIQKHFQPQSIIRQSNIELTPDAQLAPQAVAFLKNRAIAKWRIQIRPESLALADYAQLKADRTEYINALAMFMQSAAPLLEMDKKSTPVLLELLKWGLAGFKGSNEIEGVLDRAITMYQQIAQQPEQEKPDPAVQKAQVEMQISMQEHQQKMQQEAGRIENERLEFQQKMQLEREKFQAEMARDQQRFQQEMIQMQAEFDLKIASLRQELVVKRELSDIKKQEQTHAAAVQMESRNAQAGGDNA